MRRRFAIRSPVLRSPDDNPVERHGRSQEERVARSGTRVKVCAKSPLECSMSAGMIVSHHLSVD